MCHLCGSYEQDVSISSPKLDPYMSNHPELLLRNNPNPSTSSPAKDDIQHIHELPKSAQEEQQASLKTQAYTPVENERPKRCITCGHAMHFSAGLRGLYGHHDNEKLAIPNGKPTKREASKERDWLSRVSEKTDMDDGITATAEAVSSQRTVNDGVSRRKPGKQSETERERCEQATEKSDKALSTETRSSEASRGDESGYDNPLGLETLLEEIVLAVGSKMIDDALKRNGFERVEAASDRSSRPPRLTGEN